MRPNDFSDLESRISKTLINVKDGVQLSAIRFQPKKESSFPPIIFISGWGSLIDSWKVVLKKMVEKFEIYYIETREKSSAVHPKERTLTIQSLADDIPDILKYYNILDKEYILFGSSLGATVILDAISRNRLKPSLAVLIGPNAEFNAPKFWIWIAWITPPFFYLFIKPIVKWYMKKKYLDIKSDPLQYEKYCKTLDSANPSRLRRSALNFSKYSVWDKLDNIPNKVLIFTGSKDIMHDYNQTIQISKLIKNCDIIDMETNAQTHSEKMVIKLFSYINSNIARSDKLSD